MNVLYNCVFLQYIIGFNLDFPKLKDYNGIKGSRNVMKINLHTFCFSVIQSRIF